jgi:hypothetical protein
MERMDLRLASAGKQGLPPHVWQMRIFHEGFHLEGTEKIVWRDYERVKKVVKALGATDLDRRLNSASRSSLRSLLHSAKSLRFCSSEYSSLSRKRRSAARWDPHLPQGWFLDFFGFTVAISFLMLVVVDSKVWTQGRSRLLSILYAESAIWGPICCS